jgi:hypothetical protein
MRTGAAGVSGLAALALLSPMEVDVPIPSACRRPLRRRLARSVARAERLIRCVVW